MSFADENLGMAVGGGGTILCTTTGGVITAVDDDSQIDVKVPRNYVLEQNHPNPFNPTTKIIYSIPKESNVIISVYDLLGREIEKLVKEEKSRGTYELTWSAENLPSGVYFYRLQAGSFVETKKMLLLK